MEMNEIANTLLAKRNKEHHENLVGCKAMNNKHNGQEGIVTTLVETR